MGKSGELLQGLSPGIRAADPPSQQDHTATEFGPFQASRGLGPQQSPIERIEPSTSPSQLTKSCLPPLFEEQEVGVIVGLLNSEDSSLRKLASDYLLASLVNTDLILSQTLDVLRAVDPPEGGMINNFLDTLVQAIRQSGSSVPADHVHLQRLACRALEVAEVLCADNGSIYASLTLRILVAAEESSLGHTNSPTLSVRSTGTSTASKLKATTDRAMHLGVFDGVVEVVLNQLQKCTPFLKIALLASRLWLT